MNENIQAIFVYIAANFELNRIAEKDSNIQNCVARRPEYTHKTVSSNHGNMFQQSAHNNIEVSLASVNILKCK